MLFGVFIGLGSYFLFSRDLPQLPNDLRKINLSLATEVYSADGERIKVLGQRYPVPSRRYFSQFYECYHSSRGC